MLRYLWPKELKKPSDDHIQHPSRQSKTEIRLNLDRLENNRDKLTNKGYMTFKDLFYG